MSENGLSKERLIWMLTQMMRIREFEERVKSTFEEHPGVIRGHTHLADGAEASIVGSLAALRPGRPAHRNVSLPRLPDRPRHRHERVDGRDLRPGDGDLPGVWRLHAPDRRRAWLSRHVGHRRAGHPARGGSRVGRPDTGQGSGSALVLRRRRLEAGRLPRDPQHRLALEAARRLRDGEQQLPGLHESRAGGRERRGRRAARGEGQGLQHAGRDRGRRRPRGRLRNLARSRRARALRRRADARGVHGLPPQRPRQHHRAARRAAPLPGARGDRDLRQRRGVRGGAARRPGAPLPRAARDRGGLSAEEADEIAEAARKEMDEAVAFGLESPFPAPEKAVEHVYA